MRLPWQRRVAERVEVDRPDAPALARNAWRTVPALNAGMDTKPPLTAQSVELADDVSRRLRSTGERPRLIHRAGLPEPAAAGTVRGLATASVMSQRSHVSRFATGAPDDDSAEVAAADRSSEARASTQMVAARRRSSALTAVDATLAATLERSRAVRPEPRVEEEVEPVADVVGDQDRAQAVPPPGLQRTVIRRRPSGTPRPLGLQAPLPPDDTRQQAVDDAGEGRDEHAAPRREAAAHAVAATVGRLHRADVSDVQIRRDREAETLAASEHARAVTRGGEVFIPASEGPLDSGPGSGLLAHELTHVIQQRRLGRSVPLEHSPAGRRLESDAAMTERHVRGDLGAPAPPPTVSETPAPAAASPQPSTRDDGDDAATARDIQDELVASGHAFRMPDGSLVFPGGGGHLPEQRAAPMQTAVAIQRAPEDQAPAEQPSTAPVAPPAFVAGSSPARTPAPPLRYAPAPIAPAAEAPAFASQPAPDNTPTPFAFAPANPTPVSVAAAPPQEETPPIDLDDLARRVYGQVRTQLRSELLIDRERAGLLTDFR